MGTSDIIGLVVITAVGLGVVGLSIPLLRGRCTGLIAGYNTMSPEEKASWDAPALARFTGKIALACGLVTMLYGVGLICLDLSWATWVYLVLVVGLGVWAAIHCNTSKQFRK